MSQIDSLHTLLQGDTASQIESSADSSDALDRNFNGDDAAAVAAVWSATRSRVPDFSFDEFQASTRLDTFRVQHDGPSWGVQHINSPPLLIVDFISESLEHRLHGLHARTGAHTTRTACSYQTV